MESQLKTLFIIDSPLVTKPYLERLESQFLSNREPTLAKALESQLTENRVAQFQRLLMTSAFASEQLCAHEEWLADILPTIDVNWEKSDYQSLLLSTETLTVEQWDRHLRLRRNLAMARIIWRDFNRIADTLQTTGELTLLAEVAIQTTLDFHYSRLCTELGTPTNSEGKAQPMLVIGMGKLGAWELNLSSDIDLIFAYPESGNTQGGKKETSNQEFFTRLGQSLIKSLDQTTSDGFVFRVDMRLRPYGQSGALVSNFDSLEDYYQTQGREWERFAMIKARVVAHNCVGDNGDTESALMDILREFTYRGYVDFSAIDALRNLKQLINREVVRRKLGDNVKLGRGGIREVEFIGQAFQIIRGGRETELQDRRLLPILKLLDSLNCLPPGVATKLTDSYCFLRNLEHAIQGYRDQQTQDLPRDELGLSRVALVMGFADPQSFLTALNQHRDFVHEQFNAVIASPDEDDDKENLAPWRDLWLQAGTSPDQTKEPLTQLGFDDGARAAQLLQTELLQAPAVVAMAAISRERFDELVPRLLKCIAESRTPTLTLERILPLLKAVARRSAYLLLLIENPVALKQLVTLSEASPWIAERLSQHPALLDELLDPNSLYSVPAKHDLAQELRQHLLRVDSEDLEGQMEALRYFRSAHSLRVAACEVTEQLPLMKVSDYLTELAEVIIDYVLHLAWSQMVARHGRPERISPEGQNADEPDFIVVAYGKMGGIELGHDSDLDLVFVHDADPIGSTSGDSDGARSIDNASFYARLGQKIIHILNTQTPTGKLYEVDMRLRPSGNSGLLVSSFTAFEKYQKQSAWTWEHQALVRARPVAGSPHLSDKFNQLRKNVLCQARDRSKLQQEVVDMRQKMRTQLGSTKKQKEQGQFNLKQDAGGIVDIEFMVQYGVLAWAHDCPALTDYTDNIRILGELQNSGQLSAQEAHQLIEAYKAHRTLGHRLALQQQPSIVAGDQVESERRVVTQIWQRLMES